jgi:hypothetical protein
MLRAGMAATLMLVLVVGAGRAGVPIVPARVTPAVGTPTTTFVVSFVATTGCSSS